MSEAGKPLAKYEAVVAGHICLDIIPAVLGDSELEPGRLVEAGPVLISTGGAVSNTGTALHRLGTRTRLLGKIGDDFFGRAVIEAMGKAGEGLLVSPGEPTSYTLVLNFRGQDRMFLHNPGCNNTFSSQDVTDEVLQNTRLFHFGYPTLMARMFADEGEELIDLMRRAKEAGAATALDVSLPDPTSAAGKANWHAILDATLPYVDIFMPNLDEARTLLGNDGQARALATELLDMGVKIAMIKCGADGLYLRTSRAVGKIAGLGLTGDWVDSEMWSPSFEVDMRGTTGAGDAAVAGFLRGLLAGESGETSLTEASGVAGFCCERPDATSGLPDYGMLRERIDSEWRRKSYTPVGFWQREPSGVLRKG